MTSNMNLPTPLKGRNNIERTIKQQFKLIDLGIFMTYDCNLSCEYCPHMGTFNKPKDLNLDLDLLEQKLPELINKYSDDNMPIRISLSGGEPLMDWGKFERLTYILNKIHVPILGKQITTNLAMKLTVDQIRFLIENYSSIHVSLDGKYETQELRSKNTFEILMKNFITLNSINLSIENKSIISASITITEKNVKYLHENIEFFVNNDIRVTGGLDTTSQSNDPLMTEERLKEFATTFFQQVKKTKKDFNWPTDSLTDLVLTCDRNLSYTTANILPDGNIYRCPIVPVNPIANLNDNNLNINYNNLESFTEEIGLKYDQSCDNCELKYRCNYCYAATNSNRDFYCGMLRACHALDKKIMNIKMEK